MNLKRSLDRGLSIVTAAAAMTLAVHMASSSSTVADDGVNLGRELFEHKWVPNDPLSPRGDGLGPMYNADSCVACHYLGAPGGAGSLEHNVELLSREVPKASSSPRKKSVMQSNAGKVHPAFSALADGASSVLLHRFSTEARYERWRLLVLGFKPPAQLPSGNAPIVLRANQEKHGSRPPVANLPQQHGVSLRLSQRNTPALFGAGLVDSISDDMLLKLARRQAERHPDIAGRVARTADRKVGRFGWRGQVATLSDFVLTASAMELGLQSAGHMQAVDPLKQERRMGGIDLTREQCDALVAFVAELPAPRQLQAADQQQANSLAHGEELFESTGCAKCHVRDVGSAQGIYSDLLLHDMGPALEDPLPSFPEHSIVHRTVVTSSSAYGGVRAMEILVDVPPETLASFRREWRTPPLWGVRESAPYLHDGRARTLTDAIAAHGGQAESSVKRFKALDFLERSHLLDYVNSLGASDSSLTADDSP